MSESIKSAKPTVVGLVTSDKSDKTITVLVNRRVRHPKYGKYILKRKKYHVHDEENRCRMGDKVRIVSSRPISKTKSWVLQDIIEEAGI